MDYTTILMAGGSMLVLAVGAGLMLGWANRAFHVEVDPRTEAILAALPGANCGGCGYVGCAPYAEAVVTQGAAPDKCPVGGAACAKAVAAVMGVEVRPSWPFRPIVHCRATYRERLRRGDYRGERTCAAANLIGGVQGCAYGCLGFGDCDRSCPFDAIHVVDGLAVVDYAKCTGCGNCARVCPRNIITMAPFKKSRMLAVGCSNLDFGKDVKAVCTIGCIGCKACERASDMFTVVDNLPRIDYDKYSPAQLRAAEVAISKCPMKGLIYVGKPSTAGADGDDEAPDFVAVDFKTTVDDTEWHG
jgi:Na+-translocating ferredoxin:NAD+ oxidoreductase RNF subunit RnfB